MRIDLLTLFPEFFVSPLAQSMLRRAQMLGRVRFRVINLRDFTTDRHKVTDDRPFGGGPGMVMKPEPLVAAIRRVRHDDGDIRVMLLSPAGRLFDQETARELAHLPSLLLVCGHYEGVDDRVRHFIDGEISIGDYVLTGGEIPALVVVDAVTRLIPGVLGGEGAVEEESFQTGLLEYPHYTRPRDFEGLAGAGGAPRRRPRPHRPLAAGAGPQAHRGLEAGFAGHSAPWPGRSRIFGKTGGRRKRKGQVINV
jgi:tRNA (guanine37-N1)-methyltransferase